MSILFFVVIGILVISTYLGYRKGLVKIAASLISTIISIILVSLLSPLVSAFVLEHTPLEKVVTEQCAEMMTSEETQDVLMEELSRDEQVAMIEDSEIPSIFHDALKSNNNVEAYKELGAKSFGDYVGAYIAKLLADIIGFLVTFLIVKLILRIFVGMFSFVNKLPIVGKVNRVTGAVVGAGIGLLIVWIMFIAIMLLYGTTFGRGLLEDIHSSSLLNWLYEINPLLGLLGL